MPEFTIKPPPGAISLPIVHKLTELYKTVYQIGKKLNKGDKLGIWLRIENNILAGIENAILAALSAPSGKSLLVQQINLKTEIAKRLVRLSYEIKILDANNYLKLAEKLEEISKMATGWQKYLKQKEPA